MAQNPDIWAGLGCRPETALAELQRLLEQTLAHYAIAPERLAGLASLTQRADSAVLQALAADRRLPLRGFSAAALDRLTPQLLTPSVRVFAAVGCHGVAEAAALAAAGEQNALLLGPRRVLGGATCALAICPVKAQRELTGYASAQED